MIEIRVHWLWTIIIALAIWGCVSVCSGCQTIHQAMLPTCDELAKEFMDASYPIRFMQAVPGGVALLRSHEDLHADALIFVADPRGRFELEQAGVKFTEECKAPNGQVVDVARDKTELQVMEKETM